MDACGIQETARTSVRAKGRRKSWSSRKTPPQSATFISAGSPKAVALSSCGGIPQSFIEKYNSYNGIIDSKISKYQLALTDNPNAFVAALISKESAWRESAQSSSSTGLMQINTPAHTECDV